MQSKLDFIKDCRSKGMTFKEIAISLNLSIARVTQIFYNIEGGRDRVRELVRCRDKHTCQDCFKIWKVGERRFDIHHLGGLCGKRSKSYDKLKDKDNLITLCHKCHFNRPEHKCKTEKYRKKHLNMWKNYLLVGKY